LWAEFGYSTRGTIVYQKDKIMTPKELYEWAVGMGAENCDIMVNGMAIDYYPPTIDHTIQTIEIKQPMIR
jgi:hypothetical protein